MEVESINQQTYWNLVQGPIVQSLIKLFLYLWKIVLVTYLPLKVSLGLGLEISIRSA